MLDLVFEFLLILFGYFGVALWVPPKHHKWGLFAGIVMQFTVIAFKTHLHPSFIGDVLMMGSFIAIGVWARFMHKPITR